MKLRPAVAGVTGTAAVVAVVAVLSYTAAGEYFPGVGRDARGPLSDARAVEHHLAAHQSDAAHRPGHPARRDLGDDACHLSTVSLMVHIYSFGYMKGERGFQRYYAFLSLFTMSMMGLVVGYEHLPDVFSFWELVGVSSYLLIGFYYTKPEAIAASKKAFIVTRFADPLRRHPCWLLRRDLLLHARYAGRRRRDDPAGTGADVHRRRRQERHVPAAHLAARRHGGSDARLGADPCRDDGRRRCLPRGADVPPVHRLCPRGAALDGHIGVSQPLRRRGGLRAERYRKRVLPPAPSRRSAS